METIANLTKLRELRRFIVRLSMQIDEESTEDKPNSTLISKWRDEISGLKDEIKALERQNGD